jgi:hypothetical protein
MQRKSRLNIPGAVYQVMARCLDHIRSFPDDEARGFVKTVLSSVEVHRLRISRFERDGRSLGNLAEIKGRKFGIDPSELSVR